MVRVDGKPAGILALGSAAGPDDVAIIETDGLEQLQVWDLAPFGYSGMACRIPGYYRFASGLLASRTVDSVLGEQVEISGNNLTARAWPLTMPAGQQIEPGFSGAPVVTAGAERVVALTTHEIGGGDAGMALSIAEVVNLWPNPPEKLRA